jgi:hypothetical protein
MKTRNDVCNDFENPEKIGEFFLTKSAYIKICVITKFYWVNTYIHKLQKNCIIHYD